MKGLKATSVRTVYTVVVTAVAALAFLLSGVASAQAPVTVRLPLVECVTATGTTVGPKPMPATKVVNVPSQLVNKMAVYSDDQGDLYLLAPLGWACQASLGADGNDSIAVYPPGEVGTSQFALGHNWPKSAQAVTGDLLPSCYACFVGQACTFFPAAEHDLVQDYGQQLSCTPLPSGQDVSRLSSSVIAFEDPANVLGTGEPSGGVYPASGVVTFKDRVPSGAYGSAMETCTLPKTEHLMCNAAVQAFIAGWEQRTGP
ncbi:MAG TPA: hypothetical protein VMF65_16875 [Acidimicrobiales bacterium]|nr:hypothetical protein [Acidimicrobiales bacterium]